jgi:hypothetical protein
MPEDRSLSELTTSEYLLWNSDKYKLTADTASDSSGTSLRAGLKLSPNLNTTPCRVRVLRWARDLMKGLLPPFR